MIAFLYFVLGVQVTLFVTSFLERKERRRSIKQYGQMVELMMRPFIVTPLIDDKPGKLLDFKKPEGKKDDTH